MLSSVRQIRMAILQTRSEPLTSKSLWELLTAIFY